MPHSRLRQTEQESVLHPSLGHTKHWGSLQCRPHTLKQTYRTWSSKVWKTSNLNQRLHFRNKERKAHRSLVSWWRSLRHPVRTSTQLPAFHGPFQNVPLCRARICSSSLPGKKFQVNLKPKSESSSSYCLLFKVISGKIHSFIQETVNTYQWVKIVAFWLWL